MQFPVTLVLLHCYKRQQAGGVADYETIETLSNELNIAEDVTKEAGLILAARFHLFTGDLEEAQRLAQKVLSMNSAAGTSGVHSVYELEAVTVEQWCYALQYERSGSASRNQMNDLRKKVSSAEGVLRRCFSSGSGESNAMDIDALMMMAKAKQLLGMYGEVFNILNQVIAMHGGFFSALGDKAILLATAGEWDQALDTAQRLLDVEMDHLDALKVIAVHSFTQESQPHDSVQKLEDFDGALKTKEGGGVSCATRYLVESAQLFASICCRQPRALQICASILERVTKLNPAISNIKPEDEAQVFCQLGLIHIMQGSGMFEKAMKCFRESSRRDESNVQALEAMALCQLAEGATDDAEAQVELLTLMHGNLSDPDFAYLQALLIKSKQSRRKDDPTSGGVTAADHVNALLQCKQQVLGRAWDLNLSGISGTSGISNGSAPDSAGGSSYMNAFQNLLTASPDFLMILASDFLEHMDSAASAVILPSTNSLLNSTTTATTSNNYAGGGLGAGSTYMDTSTLAGGLTAGAGGGLTMATGLLGDDPASSSSSGMGGDSGGGDMMLAADSSQAVQAGMELLGRVLRTCPGFIPAYVELSRCNLGLGQHDEASRVLQQCLALQPHCSPVLLALAKVEASRARTVSADRVLEQAQASDFSVRTAPLFRLIKATVRAQQGRFDDAIAEVEQIVALPEFSFSMGGAGKGSKSDNSGQSASSDLLRSSLGGGASYADSLRLTDDDKVHVFVTYSSLLSKARRLKEANKVLSQAKVVFAGSRQEVQVLVAASQLYVEKGDFDSAIRMLDKIGHDSPTYSRAQLVKADIFLNHNHDKEGFTKCYRQLAERDPSSRNLAMLGNAYLRILNPEAAVDALQQAYALDPENGRLRGRIGRALVATHEYHRAVDFYEKSVKELLKVVTGGGGGFGEAAGDRKKAGHNAVKFSDLVNLSHDLAKLYLKLGRAESAIRILSSLLQAKDSLGVQDLNSLRMTVSTLQLLAKVQQVHAPGDVLESLLSAHRSQREVVFQLRSGGGGLSAVAGSEQVEKQKIVLGEICEQIGNAYIELVENRLAEQMFLEAVQHNPQNTRALLGIAQLHFSRGERDLCQAQCVKILLADPLAEEAAVLLSEVLFQKSDNSNANSTRSPGGKERDVSSPMSPQGPNSGGSSRRGAGAGDLGDIPSLEAVTTAAALSPEDLDNAIKPLRDYLLLQPNNYFALEKVVNLVRRAGKLEEVASFLTAAEKNDRRCMSHPGFHFCTGLYARFTNDVGRAISEFNLARKDEAWGSAALTHMVELYLNPDQEGVWEEKEAGPLDDATRSNIAAAEELLKELRPRAKDPQRVKVLENYAALATRQKMNVDRAMQSFVEMLDSDQDYLPAVLGMATGFMIEKNQHKARNLLKRIGKMEMSLHDGEDFEKANLLLAKFYIDKAKNDLAEELCKKTLVQNKSCSQAWEILGLIKEKEANYEMASDCYEKAWKLEFEASATVGFKLAFCYLKCREFVKAVDVCEAVLAQYPDYPRIADEILKKAQNSFRTTQ